MVKKAVLVSSILIIFGVSILVSVPIIILSTGFSPYINVEGIPEPFEYVASNTAGIHKLELNVDVGNIEIQYTTTRVDFLAKIELNIEMVGQNLVGESFDNYFIIEWDDSNTMPTFTMELEKDTDWFNTSKWITQNVGIIVTLNANILFDIDITINNIGNVEIFVPGGVNINNVDVNLERGNMFFDFTYCIIEGNISGNVNNGNGDIDFKVNNVEYTRNSVWNLTNDIGVILFDIIQYEGMGANITGMGETNTGIIEVVYKDFTSNVGAVFTFYRTVTQDGIWEGFEREIDTDETQWWQSRFIYYSDDFPVINNYNISLYKTWDGEYSFNLLNT